MTELSDRTAAETFHADALSASLTVRDLQASLVWYRDAIGFRVDREFVREGELRSVRLQAGAVRLLLNQDDGAKGVDRLKGAGVSFMLTTQQSIDAVAARAATHGGTLVTAPSDTPWGARMCRAQDPDGFLFTISSPFV